MFCSSMKLCRNMKVNMSNTFRRVSHTITFKYVIPCAYKKLTSLISGVACLKTNLKITFKEFKSEKVIHCAAHITKNKYYDKRL